MGVIPVVGVPVERSFYGSARLAALNLVIRVFPLFTPNLRLEITV